MNGLGGESMCRQELADMGKSKYTILYFLDYGKSFGGAVNTLIQQAILMKQEGHHVVVFFSDYLGEDLQDECREICLNAGLEYEHITYHISVQIEDIDIISIDRCYEKLKDKIISYKPDILHSVQLNPCVELVGRELGILHIMNIYPLMPDFFSIEYMNIFPHYHICDSWYYAERWKRYLKTDSTCIRTVVNKDALRRSVRLTNILRFVCVGSIYKGKNQLTVIKAFHKALQNGAQGILTLCGYSSGEYANECISYIENNGLQEKVIVKGFCVDMNQEYLNNDVLICGSTMESYPNAISEAMSHGLVVISTPVGGVPEVIKDGKNGYLTRDYTSDALCEKIIQVQKEFECGKIKIILDNANVTFMENHSPQAVKKELSKYYQYVLKDYKQRLTMENKDDVVDICGLRSAFNPIIERFNQNEGRFTETNKVSIRLWYLYHIENKIREAAAQEKEFYIWGTGKYGVAAKEMVETFLSEIYINGFLDSKKKGNFDEYTIYRPDVVLQSENIVVLIAAVNGQNEIKEELEKRNMVYNKDYFILAPRNW